MADANPVASTLIIGVAAALVCAAIYIAVSNLHARHTQLRVRRRQVARHQAQIRARKNGAVNPALTEGYDAAPSERIIVADETPPAAADDKFAV